MLAPAKLNLYLHVTGRRDDGYHLLDSLVVFTEFGDELSVKKADSLSLTIKGAFATNISTQDNLILRAAELIKNHYGVDHGAHIFLQKNIPVGAGLGGGSADAAAAMRLLNELWDINASLEDLAEISAHLGADIPACIYSKSLHMSGIGERITPLPNFAISQAILLVNPQIHVSTPEVFKRYAESANYSPSIPLQHRETFISNSNDLQNSAIEVCPDIANVLAAIDDLSCSRLARLCGSGATCFGLFDDNAAAENAARTIRNNNPSWWVEVTRSL